MTADIFDVYDDHPDVVALPLEQAVKQFQDHWGPEFQQYCQAMRPYQAAGRDNLTMRQVGRKKWEARTQRVELCLHRSVMATQS